MGFQSGIHTGLAGKHRSHQDAYQCKQYLHVVFTFNFEWDLSAPGYAAWSVRRVTQREIKQLSLNQIGPQAFAGPSPRLTHAGQHWTRLRTTVTSILELADASSIATAFGTFAKCDPNLSPGGLTNAIIP